MTAEVTQFPTYVPAMRIVIGITNAYPALVTTGTITCPGNVPTVTTMDHGYATGLKVYFVIPWGFGMPQINMYKMNQDVGFITVHPVNAYQFYVDIDTRLWTPFVVPPVTWTVSPVTGYLLARRPYRLLDDGTLAGKLVVEQFPQVLPLGSKKRVATQLHNVSETPEANVTHNVLPY